MKLYDILKEENILFIEEENLEDTLNLLSEESWKKGYIKDKEEFFKSLLAREDLVSTGIGLGVAIPHVKLKSIDKFFILIAISKTGIDWDAIDRKPVQSIFLIGGPSNEQKSYLKILSKIMLLIKNSSLREVLFNSGDRGEILGLFKNF